MVRKSILMALAFATAISAQSTQSIADDTGFAYAHDLRRERGKLCFSGHYHYGSSGAGHKTKRRAKRAAMISWQDFTAFEYGSDWASWKRANGKSVDCSKAAGSWSCDVSARPCNRYRKPRK